MYVVFPCALDDMITHDYARFVSLVYMWESLNMCFQAGEPTCCHQFGIIRLIFRFYYLLTCKICEQIHILWYNAFRMVPLPLVQLMCLVHLLPWTALWSKATIYQCHNAKLCKLRGCLRIIRPCLFLSSKVDLQVFYMELSKWPHCHRPLESYILINSILHNS